MAKGRDRIPLGETSSTSTTASSPFSALAGLRASLPVGDAAGAAGASPASAASKAPKRFADKVVVRMTKKGYGGKTVTVVSGVLEGSRDEICTSVKKALGTGARVDGDDIVIQGDVVDRVVAFVENAGAKKVVRGS